MRLAPEAGRSGAWPAGLALTAAVAAAHLWLAGQVLPGRLGAAPDERPARMAVAFVRELQPAEPPAGAAPVAPRVLARPAAGRTQWPAPEAAASAPPTPAAPAAQPEPQAPPEPVALAPLAPASEVAAPAPAAVMAASEPAATGAASTPAATAAASISTAAVTAPLAAADAASAPGGPAFDWPPSTRLSYRLTGNFRGPVEGQAQVEWLRSGTRYQVHLDVSVGPAFAPLMRRRISSEGDITAEGLRPERFDEETRLFWRDPRRLRIDMGPDLVRLARGQPWARPAGLQDTASQFVQLTWLFTLQPGLLQAGQRIPMPLALPRRIQLWQYEVGDSEALDTPAGPVQAVHVRPRPDDASEARRGGDLVPEAWFAPGLQYLPVRIFIRQDEENYINLMLDRLPQQAEPGR